MKKDAVVLIKGVKKNTFFSNMSVRGDDPLSGNVSSTVGEKLAKKTTFFIECRSGGSKICGNVVFID